MRRPAAIARLRLYGTWLPHGETSVRSNPSRSVPLSKADETARRALRCQCRRPIPKPNRFARSVSATPDPRRMAGTTSAQGSDHTPPVRIQKIVRVRLSYRVSKNETSLWSSATFSVLDPVDDVCIYTHDALPFGLSVGAGASQWSVLEAVT